MSDREEQQAPAKSGDAAWKAHKERVAERNEEVSKAGRERRAVHEQQQAAARRAADVRRLDAVKDTKKP